MGGIVDVMTSCHVQSSLAIIVDSIDIALADEQTKDAFIKYIRSDGHHRVKWSTATMILCIEVASH